MYFGKYKSKDSEFPNRMATTAGSILNKPPPWKKIGVASKYSPNTYSFGLAMNFYTKRTAFGTRKAKEYTARLTKPNTLEVKAFAALPSGDMKSTNNNCVIVNVLSLLKRALQSHPFLYRPCLSSICLWVFSLSQLAWLAKGLSWVIAYWPQMAHVQLPLLTFLKVQGFMDLQVTFNLQLYHFTLCHRRCSNGPVFGSLYS